MYIASATHLGRQFSLGCLSRRAATVATRHRSASKTPIRRPAAFDVTASAMAGSYAVEPLEQLGAVASGVDLNSEVPQDVIDRIVSDTHKHRLLLFRNQGIVSGKRQVEISRWFGEIESKPFSKHPRSPHHEVFRVSNDRREGCTGVGRTGWHIDGSFMECPYKVSVYHMHAVPKKGATTFLPFTELIARMTESQRAKWDRLWMCSDRQAGPRQPLLYRHPETGQPAMCLHLGMTAAFMRDKDKPGQATITSPQETAALLDELEELILTNSDLIYTHNWQEGDFLITDNLALAHEATPDTQRPVSEVGLRVLHRVTVAGDHVPAK